MVTPTDCPANRKQKASTVLLILLILMDRWTDRGIGIGGKMERAGGGEVWWARNTIVLIFSGAYCLLLQLLTALNGYKIIKEVSK